jgi:hypothetical protein
MAATALMAMMTDRTEHSVALMAWMAAKVAAKVAAKEAAQVAAQVVLAVN